MRVARLLALLALLVLLLVVLPLPALALSVPETLARSTSLGTVVGLSRRVDPSFTVDYLGVSWLSGREPSVRFLVDGRWTSWITAHEDDLPRVGSRTFSSLIPANDADAFQVRGKNSGIRAVAINTTDGRRGLTFVAPTAEASHIRQPRVVSRRQWGANESFRFGPGGPKAPPTFYRTQKLIVHHTVTSTSAADSAATVRAIYRYHAIDRGWGDIGYNFLIDPQGRIYKGRYSGPAGTRHRDTLTGEDASGRGVTGAHTLGANSGTMGVALLGTFSSATLPAGARSALVEHLAWEAERHGLDPEASSTYRNPASGSRRFAPNISGHRDWRATECPGDGIYAELPAIRREVAARISEGPLGVLPVPPSAG